MQFHIENMTCFGCARSVTKAIQSVDKGAVIEADPENRKIDVETSASRNEIEADGRTYRLLYQNRKPTIILSWPRAPSDRRPRC